MPPVLDVRNLVTRFYTLEGVVHAVNGVSFAIDEGETLAIVGESGCGKSVTMLSVLRMIPQPPGRIASGQAIFHDGVQARDLLQIPEAELRGIRGHQIGFIFQDPLASLNPVLTIGLQISESLIEHMGLSKEEARERAIEILDRVGIPGARQRFGDYPHQFSGGMRQRVMIAIAIACSPRLLIADEPTTALDVTVQAQIVDLTARLRSEMGVAVIWITHDLGVVAGLADRVMVMYGGMVAERGRVDDLYESPLHPYTQGLLAALPRLDAEEARRLASIEGFPPDLLQAPKNCPFAWRCTYAFERCWQEVPSLSLAALRHEVACFYDVVEGRRRDVA